MRALVYTRPHVLELQERPEPAAGRGEVVVEVRAAGICGSELEGFRSANPFRVPPLVMGHELAGVRADTGERVAVNPLLSCRACDQCLDGRQNLCRGRALIGVHRSGGFAERVVVPETALHPVGDLAFERAALIEPLANAVHGIRLLQQLESRPRRIGVVGAGMIGLAFGRAALHAGVAEVEIADLDPRRLELAARAGLTPVEALTGEHDATVDAVGAPATRAAAIAPLKPGGATLWIGLHSADAGIDSLALVRFEQRIVGAFAYAERDFREAVALAGLIEDEWFETAPLDAGVTTFLELLQTPGAAPRTVLVP